MNTLNETLKQIEKNAARQLVILNKMRVRNGKKVVNSFEEHARLKSIGK